jgi:hypothetical protein
VDAAQAWKSRSREVEAAKACCSRAAWDAAAAAVAACLLLLFLNAEEWLKGLHWGVAAAEACLRGQRRNAEAW